MKTKTNKKDKRKKKLINYITESNLVFMGFVLVLVLISYFANTNYSAELNRHYDKVDILTALNKTEMIQDEENFENTLYEYKGLSSGVVVGLSVGALLIATNGFLIIDRIKKKLK